MASASLMMAVNVRQTNTLGDFANQSKKKRKILKSTLNRYNMEDDDGSKKQRAIYFASGAILGGIAGFFVDQVLVGSSVGMLVAVLLLSRKEK